MASNKACKGRMSKSDEKVHVAVRCRPTNASERERHVRRIVNCNWREKEVAINCTGMNMNAANITKTYNFDKVFDQNSEQVNVYKSVVGPHIDEVLSGYNCTVLAYGQTGTGKTYTMEGERSDGDFTWESDPKAGIIPRTMIQIFDRLEAEEDTEFSVRVSLLEIYNEEIYDLLSTSVNPEKCKLYDDSGRKGSIIVSGLTEVSVRNKAEIYEILEQGSAKRRTHSTLMNEFSSRSHSVFSVTVHIKEVSQNHLEEEELVKIGKLNLVDLAGSENIARSGAVDQRAREAGNINQSLLTLGRCITALVDRCPHVPFRESKLTRILQDSLGGSTKTSIIATISPGADNLEETQSTLDYASRAKNIHNKPKINQKLTKRTLIKQYVDEIEKLRRELECSREKNGVYMDSKQHEELLATLDFRQEEITRFEGMFKDINKQLEEKSTEYISLKEEYEDVYEKLKKNVYLKKKLSKLMQEQSEQANELVDVTDNIYEEKIAVHDKVDRVQTVVEDKADRAKELQQVMRDETSLVQKHVDRFIKDSQSNTKCNFEALDEFYASNVKNISSLNNCVADIASSFADFIKKTEASVNEFYQSTVPLSECTEILQKQKESIQEMAKQATDELNLKMNEVQSSVQNELNALRCQLELKKQMATQWNKTIQENSSEISKLFQSMENELRKHKEQRESTNTKAIAKMKMLLDDLESDNKSISDNTMDVFMTTKSTVNQHNVCMKEESEKTRDRIHEVVNLTEQQLASIQQQSESLSGINEKTTSKINRMETYVDGTADLVWNQTSTAIEDIKTFHMKTTKSLKTFDESSCRQTDELTMKIKEEETEVEDHHDEMKGLLEESKDITESIEQTVTSGLKSFNQRTNEFCDLIATPLLPTGSTPSRKDYVYPRRFLSLPPEEALLTSFTEHLDILDEDEDDAASQDSQILTEEDEKESVVSEQSSHDHENIENELNVSITIPTSSVPFFKAGKKRGNKKGRAGTKIPSVRQPLQATGNTKK